MIWTARMLAELRRLAKDHYLTEAADIMKLPRVAVQYAARNNGIKSGKKKGSWNSKHAHLRKQVMTYFLTHTWDETRIKFGLTISELKSLFTVGYRDPDLAHLRKDKRNHDPWTIDELLFAVRHSGVRSRVFIGQSLKRGKGRVVKERFKTFNSGTKWLNGMPMKWALELWGERARKHGIKTDAGPYSGKGPGGGDFRFVIVPWTDCERLALSMCTLDKVRQCVKAMAKFQRWIHGVDDPRWIRRKLKEGLGK